MSKKYDIKNWSFLYEINDSAIKAATKAIDLFCAEHKNTTFLNAGMTSSFKNWDWDVKLEVEFSIIYEDTIEYTDNLDRSDPLYDESHTDTIRVVWNESGCSFDTIDDNSFQCIPDTGPYYIYQYDKWYPLY